MGIIILVAAELIIVYISIGAGVELLHVPSGKSFDLHLLLFLFSYLYYYLSLVILL